ncbi:MAG: TonB-dependent siderophore receptor [Burkholderiaceae bacterium]
MDNTTSPRRRAAGSGSRAAAFALRTALASTALAACADASVAQTSTPAGGVLAPVTVTDTGEKAYNARSSTTATRTDTPLRDVPQSISVVTQQQMQDQAAQSIAEAVRYVPGVTFAQGEGNRETPIFRGISTTADFYFDGVRDDVQYYRDLYNVERVEVLRGPNAMIFGRGATGGLINRVSKQAGWTPILAGSLTLGSYDNKRLTVDVNQPLSEQFAVRVTAMAEDSGSYRDGVWIRRKGINPTLSWRPSARTLVTAGYEHFEDDRIADRGIPSFRGRPVDTSRKTFFGSAAQSPTNTSLDAFNASIEHAFDNGVTVRNRTRVADQDKFYQNVFPGAVDATGTSVTLSAYNNAMSRKSWFNQTDVSYALSTGSIRHRLLAGAEFGEQDTDNFRNSGYFPGNATNTTVPLGSPTTGLPVTFRQSATDADNSGTAKVAAVYVQDQIELSPSLQIIAGLRYDSFKVDFTNNRNGQNFKSSDDLFSPRLGVVYKPMTALSLYANYSEAYQPRAGEQLSSLSLSNSALKPEKFKNYELGAKWDVLPNLTTTAAVYQLDRTNVVVLDPTDPTATRTMLSDGQRIRGLELSATGNVTSAWTVAGGYAFTDAEFTADTSATQRAGGKVGNVPRHTFSLWNRYQFDGAFGAALGVIHRTRMFAANEMIATAASPTPNVELPGYTRFDAALYYRIDRRFALQLNVENLFDKKYYAFANSNNNITPGSPRAFRLTLNASL